MVGGGHTGKWAGRLRLLQERVCMAMCAILTTLNVFEAVTIQNCLIHDCHIIKYTHTHTYKIQKYIHDYHSHEVNLTAATYNYHTQTLFKKLV